MILEAISKPIKLCKSLQQAQYVVYTGMEDYPRTLMEFERWFSSEDACQQYIFKLR